MGGNVSATALTAESLKSFPYECAFSVIPRDLSGILAERCSECSLALDENGRVRAGLIAFLSRREGGCTIFRTR